MPTRYPTCDRNALPKTGPSAAVSPANICTSLKLVSTICEPLAWSPRSGRTIKLLVSVIAPSGLGGSLAAERERTELGRWDSNSQATL